MQFLANKLDSSRAKSILPRKRQKPTFFYFTDPEHPGQLIKINAGGWPKRMPTLAGF
jgi:hypothetical protein